MKQRIFALLAAAGLLSVASCTRELTDPYESDDLVTVEFVLSTEATATATRAGNVHYPASGEFPQISDGSKADRLIYAVYDGEGKLMKNFGAPETDAEKGIGVGQIEVDVERFPYTFSLTLVRGQEYSIAFWAQDSDSKAFNTLDLRAVTVDYKSAESNLNNDELRDAFCKTETFTVTSASASRYIELTRPFAQINMGIPKSEYDALIKSGFRFIESKAHIENVATELDIVSNSVNASPDKRQAIDYEYAAIPAFYNYGTVPADETLEKDRTNYPGKEQFLKIDLNHDAEIAPYGEKNAAGDEGRDETYHWLSMCYILPADRVEGTSTYSTTLDRLELTLKPEKEGQNEVTFSLTQVPVQRNWRTNIFGNLLTSEVNLVVDLQPMYSGDYNYPNWPRIYEGVTYDAAEDCILISNGLGLQWLSDATNGKWPEKKDYYPDNDEYDADLFLQAAKETEWPKDGFFHFKGVTIKLQNDIDLANHVNIDGIEEYFTPIGFGSTFEHNNNLKEGKFFNGIFDGGNHTISNLKTVRPENNADDHSFGLFSTIGRNTRIMNVRLKNIDIAGNYCTGGIVGRVYSHFDDLGYDGEEVSIINCYVDGGLISVTTREEGSGSNKYDDANNIGGIAGIFYNSGRIEDCFVRNVTIRAYRALGGILGQVGGDYLGHKVRLKNNRVYSVTLIADQFQEYKEEKGYEIDNIFVAKNTVGGIIYEGSTVDNPFGSNVGDDNKIYAFMHKTLNEGDDDYKYVADLPGKRFTEIGKSELLDNPPLDIFPRLIRYTDYVHFSSSILGGPSAWKKYSYESDTDYRGTPDRSSGRVGLFLGEMVLDGDTDGNDDTIDNHTLTVSDVEGDKDCALYIWKWATVKNLTVHGAGYANEAICLAPESGKTILLDNVVAYDAELVLTDEGNGNGSTLTVTDSNLRGNVKYSAGYKEVSFSNTIFENSTKYEDDNEMTVGSATSFTGCTFKAPYTIIVGTGASATFSDCKAIVSGKETEVAIENGHAKILITVDAQGEPQVSYE